jgi:hypothetical protein
MNTHLDNAVLFSTPKTLFTACSLYKDATFI